MESNKRALTIKQVMKERRKTRKRLYRALDQMDRALDRIAERLGPNEARLAMAAVARHYAQDKLPLMGTGAPNVAAPYLFAPPETYG